MLIYRSFFASSHENCNCFGNGNSQNKQVGDCALFLYPKVYEKNTKNVFFKSLIIVSF